MASGLVAVLACAWQAIKARHDEVPSVVLAVGSHRRAAKTICLGQFVPIGWSPAHETEPRELQAAHKEFDDATANGDLTAALAALAQALLISARQLSEDAKACRSEVFITDDGLCGSPADVLATLLHEAAHAIADRRGIKATSRQGDNARFKVLAEEVGLEVRRDPTIGLVADHAGQPHRCRLQRDARRARPGARPSSAGEVPPDFRWAPYGV